MTTYTRGDHVRVADDAPVHPGITGTIVDEQTYGDIHGYWILPGPGCVRVWVPADALTPAAATHVPPETGETR